MYSVLCKSSKLLGRQYFDVMLKLATQKTSRPIKSNFRIIVIVSVCLVALIYYGCLKESYFSPTSGVQAIQSIH